jgi:hypothetical protein
MTATNLCPVCGAAPCFAICHEADPFYGDQEAENADYEFNARFDCDAEAREEAHRALLSDAEDDLRDVPQESEAPDSCCREPRYYGGRCDNCGTWDES